MIQVLFEFGGQKKGIEVEGDRVVFFDFQTLLKSEIDGLQLSYEGVIKEHPDLKENPEWRRIAIERFKNHIKSFKTEEERVDYLIEDLRKWGYIPLYKQKKGFRSEKIK